jgi:hypothetical protein
MSSTYVIETRRGAAGIVVRDGRGFRFFAAMQELGDLDGRLFATPRAAEAAAFDHLYGLKARTGRRQSDNAPSSSELLDACTPIGLT